MTPFEVISLEGTFLFRWQGDIINSRQQESDSRAIHMESDSHVNPAPMVQPEELKTNELIESRRPMARRTLSTVRTVAQAFRYRSGMNPNLTGWLGVTPTERRDRAVNQRVPRAASVRVPFIVA